MEETMEPANDGDGDGDGEDRDATIDGEDEDIDTRTHTETEGTTEDGDSEDGDSRDGEDSGDAGGASPSLTTDPTMTTSSLLSDYASSADHRLVNGGLMAMLSLGAAYGLV
jgi:hypothetical protein